MSGLTVNVDHLSFSAPISAMKLLDDLPCSLRFKKFKVMPVLSMFKPAKQRRYAEADFSQSAIVEHIRTNLALPNKKVVREAPAYLRKEFTQQFNEALTECYYSRLLAFIYHVLDFSIGEERGFGQFFYKNSRPLYLKRSKGTQLAGMLFFEGNQDTFFLQISGAGCKDLFSRVHAHTVHKWLYHLGVTQLNRIDLCVDDYTGNFGTDYALKAAYDDFFYGGHGPYPDYGQDCRYNRKGQAVRDIVTVGSRQSKVYWRIYDKALEQAVTGVWYRNEVELKKVDVSVLMDTAGYFAGLCPFARTINADAPLRFIKKSREAVDCIEAKIKWLRRQCGSSLAQVIEFCFGDVNRALSLVLKSEDAVSWGLPPMYQMLVSDKMGQLENTLEIMLKEMNNGNYATE